jgi:hypothetical protein
MMPVIAYVRVIFDTSTWQENDLRWTGGFGNGIRVPCSSMADIKNALDSAEALGHTAEVIYP